MALQPLGGDVLIVSKKVAAGARLACLLAAAGDSAFLAFALTIMTIRLNLTSLLGFILKHSRLSIQATSRQQRGAQLQHVQKVLSSRLHLPMDENASASWRERLVPRMGSDPPTLPTSQTASTREARRHPSCSTVHSLPVTLPRKPEQRSAFCVLTCSRRTVIPRIPYLEPG